MMRALDIFPPSLCSHTGHRRNVTAAVMTHLGQSFDGRRERPRRLPSSSASAIATLQAKQEEARTALARVR
jgi:hypothetical protein